MYHMVILCFSLVATTLTFLAVTFKGSDFSIFWSPFVILSVSVSVSLSLPKWLWMAISSGFGSDFLVTDDIPVFLFVYLYLLYRKCLFASLALLKIVLLGSRMELSCRVLAKPAESPGFDLQHGINCIWCHMLAILTLGRWRRRRKIIKSSLAT